MATINLQLLPWQQQVIQDKHRFSVVAAGRRTGKSHLAAVTLLLAALDGKPGKVFYVAPTQGMAKDILWDKIYELAGDIIEKHNIKDLTLTLSNGATIYLKGADRPDTLRGVSLKHLVLDEYAFMKPDVFDTILRPALSDLEGTCLFIGTPEGRNHFYDIYIQGTQDVEEWDEWNSYHFTSYDNPYVPRKEIERARKTLPAWAFAQEYMASFDAQGSEHFDVDNFKWFENRPSGNGDWYIAIDLAGFEMEGKKKRGRRDNSAIACVFVDENGDWWVNEIIHGRWTLDETVERIFNAVDRYRPRTVGIEKGIAQQAVMSPLQEIMRRTSRVFRVELLTHGNQKKTDRILWALQGRVENQKIHLRRDESWNLTFMDEASNFPNPLVHDDCLDALAYIDQIAKTVYYSDWDMGSEWEPLDATAGY